MSTRFNSSPIYRILYSDEIMLIPWTVEAISLNVHIAKIVLKFIFNEESK